MGYEAKNNPTAIAAKQGLIPPKKKSMSKRQRDALLMAKIAEKLDEKTGLYGILRETNKY